MQSPLVPLLLCHLANIGFCKLLDRMELTVFQVRLAYLCFHLVLRYIISILYIFCNW